MSLNQVAIEKQTLYSGAASCGQEHTFFQEMSTAHIVFQPKQCLALFHTSILKALGYLCKTNKPSGNHTNICVLYLLVAS